MFDLATSTTLTRTHLLSGPTVTLSLSSTTPSLPAYTIPRLPRRMLFALSTTAAKQLSHHTTTTVHLPAGSATPAALEYVVCWMKAVCRRKQLQRYAFATPTTSGDANALVPPRADFRAALLTFLAARALGVALVERAYARFLCDWVAGAESVVGLGRREVGLAVEVLGRGSVVGRALVRRGFVDGEGAGAERWPVARCVLPVEGMVGGRGEPEVVREMREVVGSVRGEVGGGREYE